jgi:hypothetical protein
MEDLQARPVVLGYPARPPRMFEKFVRALLLDRVAYDLGPEAFAFLCAVANVENHKDGCRPALIFNSQLFELSGSRTMHTAERAREKACESGWLHYEPGVGARPGKYWVLLPDACLAKRVGWKIKSNESEGSRPPLPKGFSWIAPEPST